MVQVDIQRETVKRVEVAQHDPTTAYPSRPWGVVRLRFSGDTIISLFLDGDMPTEARWLAAQLERAAATAEAEIGRPTSG